jgi:hypothetical protein
LEVIEHVLPDDRRAGIGGELRQRGAGRDRLALSVAPHRAVHHHDFARVAAEPGEITRRRADSSEQIEQRRARSRPRDRARRNRGLDRPVRKADDLSTPLAPAMQAMTR